MDCPIQRFARLCPCEPSAYNMAVPEGGGVIIAAANARLSARLGREGTLIIPQYTVHKSKFAMLDVALRILCAKMVAAVCIVRDCVPVRQLRRVDQSYRSWYLTAESIGALKNHRECRRFDSEWPAGPHQAAPKACDSAALLSVSRSTAPPVRMRWRWVAAPPLFS